MSNQALQTPLAFDITDLELAAEDLFLRRRYGHLDAFYYSTQNSPNDPVCGAQLWGRLLQHNKHYKLPAEESNLIQTFGFQLQTLSERFTQFIDFGPGSVEAFNAKTRPIIDLFKPDLYRPIDLCGDFLSEILSVMSYIDPDIKIEAEQRDFLTDPIAPANGRSCLYWGGSGFGNIPTKDNFGLPIDGIRSRLIRVKNILSDGGKFILTLDTTRNYEALMQAYGHPMNAAFTLNLLHQIQRDCPNIVIDPTAWIYQPIWRPERYLLEHHIVATRPQTIKLSGQTVHVKTGESFVTEHSFKLPVNTVLQIAQSVGWSHTMTLGDDGQVQLLILSA